MRLINAQIFWLQDYTVKSLDLILESFLDSQIERIILEGTLTADTVPLLDTGRCRVAIMSFPALHMVRPYRSQPFWLQDLPSKFNDSGFEVCPGGSRILASTDLTNTTSFRICQIGGTWVAVVPLSASHITGCLAINIRSYKLCTKFYNSSSEFSFSSNRISAYTSDTDTVARSNTAW
jgi:hypothetical protein